MKINIATEPKVVTAKSGQSVTFEQANMTLVLRISPVGNLLKVEYETVKRIPALLDVQKN